MASISKDWQRKPLGDVADVISGYAFKSSEFGDRGIPVIKIKNIRVGSVDISEADRVDEKYLTIPERYHVRAGDVLISLTGSHITQPNSVVGRVARHSASLPNCLLNQRAGKVIIKDRNVCDLAFVFYALSEPETMRAIAVKAHGAANQANVSPTDVESIEIPLPPLPAQTRIAAVLSAYDGLIENSQRRIQVLESITRNLYRDWFVRSANSEKDAPRNTTSTFGALCELVKQPFDEREHGDRPLLDLARMPQRTIAPTETGKASELKTSRILFESGDTLFGAIRCYLHKVLAAHYPGVTNTSVLVLRPRHPDFRSLVAMIASDTDTIRWADTHSTGAKMPVLNWGVFQTMPAPLPSGAQAQQFESLAGLMLDQIGVLANQIQNLRRTRDLLLPRLLSGQVELAQLNDKGTTL